MPITTTTTLPAPVQSSFNYKLLLVPTPNFIHKLPADKYTMPRNGGTTMRFRRPNNLLAPVVPLGNTGMVPPSQQLTAVDIDAKISFYGTWVEISEQVTLQNQDPTLNWATERLGVAMRKAEDQLTRDMLAGTAAAVNCVNGINADIPTEITKFDVDEIGRQLLGADAKTVLDNIEGDDKFGTAPVRDAYFALGHTDLTKELEFSKKFIHKSQYPSPMNALRSEWGALGNFRFLVSSVGSKELNASAKGRDRYNVFCVGLEAYACIEQDGYSAQFMYRPPEIVDPLGLKCTAGVKFAEVPRILNDMWVINLRCTLRY